MKDVKVEVLDLASDRRDDYTVQIYMILVAVVRGDEFKPFNLFILSKKRSVEV